MPNVLHAFKVHKSEVEGGIPEVVDLVARGLMPEWRPTIAVARAKGRGRDDTINDVRVVRAASAATVWSLPIAPGYPFMLRRLMGSADVVALHAPFPLADLGAAFRFPRDKGLVVHWHADIVRQRAVLPLVRPLIRRVLARADAIVVSHAGVTDASAVLPAWRDKVSVIPYGIDGAPWRALDDEDRVEIARLAAAGPLFVAIGRLVTYKGFDVAISAMRSAPGRLVICGTGAEEARLKAMVAQAGLDARVEIAGFVPAGRLRRLLHAATALVMPSTTIAEAFGIVQLEAMACGRAIVNTDLPTAVPWVARHEREALTVPVGDAPALAAAMARLASDLGFAARLGAAGSARFDAEFTLERFRARIAAVYEGAFAARRGGG